MRAVADGTVCGNHEHALQLSVHGAMPARDVGAVGLSSLRHVFGVGDRPQRAKRSYCN